MSDGTGTSGVYTAPQGDQQSYGGDSVNLNSNTAAPYLAQASQVASEGSNTVGSAFTGFGGSGDPGSPLYNPQLPTASQSAGSSGVSPPSTGVSVPLISGSLDSGGGSDTSSYASNAPSSVGGIFSSISNPSGTAPQSSGVDLSNPNTFVGPTQLTASNAPSGSNVVASPSATPAGGGGGGGGTGGIISVPGTADQSIDLSSLTNTYAPGGPAAGGASPAQPKANTSGAGGFDWSKLLSPQALVGAAGLGYAAYQQNRQTAGIPSTGTSAANVTGAADLLKSQGANTTSLGQSQYTSGSALQDYLTTGTLPAAYQAQVDQAVASQKASIVSQFASRGQDVSRNADGTYRDSNLQAEINNADQNGLILKSQLKSQLNTAGTNMVNTANTLLQNGASDTQMSAQLYEELINLDQSLSKNVGSAISNFASSLAGGGGTTIRIGGTSSNA